MSAPSAPAPAIEPAAPVTAAAGPVIEAEDDNWDDGDSALGSITGSETASIGSSILNYRKENGRTYHSYKDGKYVIPNDEEENDRLDLQHQLCILTFDNKLYTAPIPKEQKLHRVLDIGTGTGIWAIDFADQHPEAEVLGIDLSPIQPSFTPPNLQFQIDDIEEEWTFHTKFDFIYSRMMTGSVKDWPKLFSKAFNNLQPGGWLEVVDVCMPYSSDDGTLPPNSAIVKWSTLLVEGCKILGREITPYMNKENMINAGFKNVKETIYKWPSNQWPKDRKLKELGAWNYENVSSGLEGLSLALFTRVLGYSKEELEVFLVDVRKELKDRKIHAWTSIYVVTGQKPDTVL